MLKYDKQYQRYLKGFHKECNKGYNLKTIKKPSANLEPGDGEGIGSIACPNNVKKSAKILFVYCFI